MPEPNSNGVNPMASYRISIDREACVGDRLCCETAPDTFDMDEDGKSVVKNPEGDPPKIVLAAAMSCRLQAISLFDAVTAEKVWPR